jgi:hypothetical protein
MGFKEYFLAHEMKMRGVLDYKDNPIVPTSIPKTGFVNSGATKMRLWTPAKPYKPIFRMGKSALKS